jgi:DNA-binding NarL/FixJ family response regulator
VWSDELRGLTPKRIQDILLVSSAYDAFVLEEDGPLADRLFGDYSELDLASVPRLTHVTKGGRALALLSERRFDLVVTVERMEDMEVAEFGRRVWEAHPELPVLLLVFDEGDIARARRPPPGIDRAFLWTGDTRTLLAAIKLTEDRLNVEHDTRTAGLPVILVVEDRVRAWSRFLSVLYPALLSQARSLVDDALSHAQGHARARVRPKVLLSGSFDEALDLFGRYRELVCALISDVQFPLGEGREQAHAGIALARAIRAEAPDLPVLLMSSEDHRALATAVDAYFLDKSSPDFRAGVVRFLRGALGFGEFVFRLADGTEVGRARNVFELEQELARVPAESIGYHAGGNHFSMWLKARGMFAVVQQLRPRQLADFADFEQVRAYLVDVLREARTRAQEGMISDFTQRTSGVSHRFVRMGRGSVGGKGRGVAFLTALVKQHGLLRRFPGIEVRVPRSIVLGTEVFDRTLEPIDTAALEGLADRDILARVQALALPGDVEHDLRTAFATLRGPVAVRSSSVLEDSRHHPFAGVYATYMLPNQGTADANFAALARTVKAVYASTFYERARTYATATAHGHAANKMAVILQPLVGRAYGSRFYPQLSGVAQSYNYYPIGSQKAEDGVAAIALGLGHAVVGGRAALRFSPGAPDILPQFTSARALARQSQQSFMALDLAREDVEIGCVEDVPPSFGLDVAEADGTLALVGSVYDPQDDVIRDVLARPGPRVVTMNSILRWNALPLASTLRELLALLRESMGGEVEIEFALDVAPALAGGATPGLYLLQLRPMATDDRSTIDVDVDGVDASLVLCRSGRALGHGLVDGIRDIVYVEVDDLPSVDTRAIAREVGEVNRQLLAERRPYVLIGPGRWGTTDPSLGVPVDWSQIAGAKVIIETPTRHRNVELSQGTHFFHNLTALRLGYLSVAEGDDLLDRAWLDALPASRRSGHLRHVRLGEPLLVVLDGRRARGVVLKHAPIE